MARPPLKRGPCWIARFSRLEPFKAADGSIIKLKPHSCLHTWECFNRLSQSLFLEETTRLTELGLVTDPNPLGVDRVLEWLGKRCSHPEKRRILAFIAELEPLAVVIPWPVLRLIEEHAGGRR